MRYLIDSSAWVEYLKGGVLGEKVHNLINESGNEIYFLGMILSEVVSKAERESGAGGVACEAIIRNSKFKEISVEVFKRAGIRHSESRKKKSSMGLVDAVIIESAIENGFIIVSKDSHFKECGNVLFLEEE